MSDQFKIGDDVFVRDPKAVFPDCTCIVGPIISIENGLATIKADVGKIGGGYHATVSLPLGWISHRIGTPISQLSGRPSHRGYERFCAIAASYGYD